MSGTRECPECGESISYSARHCACGWGGKPQREAPRNDRCAAHGCPMAGSITATTKASESAQWLCRFHFGEPAQEWADISRRVRNLDAAQRRNATHLPTERRAESS